MTAGRSCFSLARGTPASDADFKELASGSGSGAPSFSGAGDKYVVLYGPIGAGIGLNLVQ